MACVRTRVSLRLGVAFDAAASGMRTYILIALRARGTPGKHDHTGASYTCM